VQTPRDLRIISEYQSFRKILAKQEIMHTFEVIDNKFIFEVEPNVLPRASLHIRCAVPKEVVCNLRREEAIDA
jgi:hypothetical protein